MQNEKNVECFIEIFSGRKRFSHLFSFFSFCYFHFVSFRFAFFSISTAQSDSLFEGQGKAVKWVEINKQF